MPTGINVHLGLAKEASWGTAQVATDYVAIVRSTMQRKQEYFSRNELRGIFAAPNKEQSTSYGEGDIEFLAHPNVWGTFLRSCFGPSSDTTVVSHSSGITYSHVFTQINSVFDPQTCHQWPYTYELFRDAAGGALNSARQFYGGVVETLRLQVSAGTRDPIVRGTATIWSKGVQSIATTAVSLETYGPFLGWYAQVTKDGGSYLMFEDFQVEIKNNLERVYRLDNTQTVDQMAKNGYQDVTFRGTITFNDEGDWDRFINNSAGPLQFLFINSFAAQISSGYYPQMNITIPLAQYTSHVVDITGPTRLRATLEGYGQYNSNITTSGTAIRITLQNERATY